MESIVETTKMSTKGQVIIPKDIREFIHAEENTIFTVSPIDRETVVLKKLDKDKAIQEFRMIRKRVKRKLSEREVNTLVQSARKS